MMNFLREKFAWRKSVSRHIWILTFICVPLLLSSAIIMTVLSPFRYNSNLYSILGAILACGVACVAIIVIYMLSYIVRSNQAISRDEIQMAQLNYELERVKITQANLEDMHIFRHDIKNLLIALDIYSSSGDVKGQQECIDKLTARLNKNDDGEKS